MNLLSGERLNTDELLAKLQRNVSFRVTSAREMITGIRGESQMSPLQRRRKIRENRLDLMGVGNDDDLSQVDGNDGGTVGENKTPETSNQISTSSSGESDSTSSVSDSTPSMSEVDIGTKSRAEDSGFSDVN
jgi:hypothetical protein